mmetsp:Transcript_245/g.509  ORF Transcript_245/g.509 Transcript_245/m.509 type:complete len:367 (+) Transcript_245:139-1239(+)
MVSVIDQLRNILDSLPPQRILRGHVGVRNLLRQLLACKFGVAVLSRRACKASRLLLGLESLHADVALRDVWLRSHEVEEELPLQARVARQLLHATELRAYPAGRATGHHSQVLGGGVLHQRGADYLNQLGQLVVQLQHGIGQLCLGGNGLVFFCDLGQEAGHSLPQRCYVETQSEVPLLRLVALLRGHGQRGVLDIHLLVYLPAASQLLDAEQGVREVLRELPFPLLLGDNAGLQFDVQQLQTLHSRLLRQIALHHVLYLIQIQTFALDVRINQVGKLVFVYCAPRPPGCVAARRLCELQPLPVRRLQAPSVLVDRVLYPRHRVLSIHRHRVQHIHLLVPVLLPRLQRRVQLFQLRLLLQQLLSIR